MSRRATNSRGPASAAPTVVMCARMKDFMPESAVDSDVVASALNTVKSTSTTFGLCVSGRRCSLSELSFSSSHVSLFTFCFWCLTRVHALQRK